MFHDVPKWKILGAYEAVQETPGSLTRQLLVAGDMSPQLCHGSSQPWILVANSAGTIILSEWVTDHFPMMTPVMIDTVISND